MKKILILGGAEKMLPVIRYANSQKYYVILCDYLSDNPGRHYADEYYDISATDFDAVLELAKSKKIDGILSYSSDLIALTAAYVGNKLNLPSNPYDAVLTLGRKDLFRTFLEENEFNCPQANSYDSYELAIKEIDKFRLPFMVKPVDLAGSTGVAKISHLNQFEQAFKNALEISKVKKVIVEEYIQMNHEYMIAGDAFVLNGEVEFMGLLNSHRGAEKYPFIPTGTSYPVFLNDHQIEEVTKTVQKVINILGIRLGGLNLELMYDNNENLYIIEIAPRNGGNMIPEFLKMATGVDLISALVEASMGNNKLELDDYKKSSYYSTYVIHSNKNGKLDYVEYKNGIENKIVRKVMNINRGEYVYEFDSATKAIGIVFLKFDNLEEEKYILKNIEKYIEVVLED